MCTLQPAQAADPLDRHRRPSYHMSVFLHPPGFYLGCVHTAPEATEKQMGWLNAEAVDISRRALLRCARVMCPCLLPNPHPLVSLSTRGAYGMMPCAGVCVPMQVSLLEGHHSPFPAQQLAYTRGRVTSISSPYRASRRLLLPTHTPTHVYVHPFPRLTCPPTHGSPHATPRYASPPSFHRGSFHSLEKTKAAPTSNHLTE